MNKIERMAYITVGGVFAIAAGTMLWCSKYAFRKGFSK